MLYADQLFVVRNDRILFDGVGFSLAAGGALLLVGPNGAGKSTLLRVLAGLRRPDGGTVRWDGAEILADRDAHSARVTWLSHQDAVKPGLSAAENLAFAAKMQGGDVASALDRMGLGELADLPARMLSAGQKRRLALARVMLGDRPLWLLDEPTNGLDSGSVVRLAEAIAAHRARGGMVIAASHLDLALPDAAILDLTAR